MSAAAPQQNRREARRLAVVAVYAADVTGYTMDEVLNMARHMRQDWNELPEFTLLLCRTVYENAQELDTQIASVLENWKLERVAPVERAMLKLGGAEILFLPEIPPRVTINEYIELAKSYANENAPAFINGVLDKLVQLRQKQDFQAAR